jgi:hypothetical protein
MPKMASLESPEEIADTVVTGVDMRDSEPEDRDDPEFGSVDTKVGREAPSAYHNFAILK